MTAPHLNRNVVGQGALAAGSAHQDSAERELDQLWTVDEVAALLKVSRSWVYEHTRARTPRVDRLPFLKIGKYVRFQSRAIGDFLAKRSRVA
jgi:excisionase family DNA binding protein